MRNDVKGTVGIASSPACSKPFQRNAVRFRNTGNTLATNSVNLQRWLELINFFLTKSVESPDLTFAHTNR